jgi:predicted enzyme related to lactoylglutathione lyase
MRHILTCGIAASLIFLSACSSETESPSEQKNLKTTTDMNNASSNLISMFEIPASNITRAIAFYEEILGINIELTEMEGMKMGILPYENQPVTGILIETEGYTPSTDGVVVYFNAGNDVQIILDKVVENGGKILVPKTAHADESGFFAIVLDTEGNKIGLNSPE